MKKIVVFLILIFGMTLKATAVSLSDLPTIINILYQLQEDVAEALKFASELKNSNDSGFVYTLNGSTQTFTATTAQKNGLIAKYNDMKMSMVNHFNQLP